MNEKELIKIKVHYRLVILFLLKKIKKEVKIGYGKDTNMGKAEFNN